MRVLGLSYGFHDASAALVVDGDLVAVATEERLTRQKHDAYFPQFAIQSCLDRAQLKLSQIDRVAYYESTETKWTRVLSTSLKKWPFTYREFNTSMKSWLGGKLWTEALLAQRLNIPAASLVSFNHHNSHAAQAFMGSGFSEAAILTVDAVGEWETCTEYTAHWEKGKPQFTKINAHHYPHSLGLFYSAITHFLGFKPMSDECSTMALAAFGDAEYLTRMRECIAVNEQGKIIINNEYFQFDRYFSSPFSKKFEKIFGPPAQLKYAFSSLVEYSPTGEEQRMANIAYAAQKVFTECMLKLAKNLKKKTGLKNLCLAGGAALNCVANTLLLAEAGFDNIYIPRDPGDGGASIGAAYLAYFKENSRARPMGDYAVSLGQSYPASDTIKMLEQLTPAKLQKHKKIGTPKHFKEQWHSSNHLSEKELSQKTASLINDGKVVGWFQGGVENGPRALGYRSLLFKASDIKIANRVSQVIKDRAGFRPYALSMTESAAEKILEIKNLLPRTLRYMQLTVPVKNQYREQLRSGLHIDQTTRPQVVYKDDNPLFHKLLSAYGKLSQVEALVNTSFNESGYPIVEGPAEALLMFARTDMDALVLNDCLIVKDKKNAK